MSLSPHFDPEEEEEFFQGQQEKEETVLRTIDTTKPPIISTLTPTDPSTSPSTASPTPLISTIFSISFYPSYCKLTGKDNVSSLDRVYRVYYYNISCQGIEPPNKLYLHISDVVKQEKIENNLSVSSAASFASLVNYHGEYNLEGEYLLVLTGDKDMVEDIAKEIERGSKENDDPEEMIRLIGNDEGMGDEVEKELLAMMETNSQDGNEEHQSPQEASEEEASEHTPSHPSLPHSPQPPQDPSTHLSKRSPLSSTLDYNDHSNKIIKKK